MNSAKRVVCSLCSVILLLFAMGVASAQGVSKSRYARLTRGINMGEWFRDRYQPRYGVDDLKLLRALGVRHVRLPVGSRLLFDEAQPTTLNAANLAHLDTAVQMILDQDMAVMLCVFDDAGKVWKEDAYSAKYADFWRVLAKHFRGTDPERVFLEGVNEPAAETAERWNELQPKLLAAMREGAPQHTLIAFANMRTAPDQWDNVGGLERLKTVSDPNVVYNVHCFEPMTFTHQGATWGGKLLRYLHDLPYPSSPEAIAPLLDGIEASARAEASDYGRAMWNREKMDSLLRRIAEWGRKHHVSVLCNEIGVYRVAAPAASRLRWLTDVRQVLEKYRIGWGMWEYDSGFGLVNTADQNRVVDEGTARALGLNVQAAKHLSVPVPTADRP